MTTYPASPHQQRLWLAQQLDPQAPHNLPLLMRVGESISTDSLQQRLDELVAAHEALRTRLRHVGQELMQEVLPEARVNLRVVDELRLDEEAAPPFDLASAPLLRAVYCNGTLLVVAHQAVADRVSLRLVLGTLAGVAARPVELHYVDHSEWQRGLPPEVVADLTAYWQREHRGRPEGVALPSARSRDATRRHVPGSVRVPLPADVVQALARPRSGDVRELLFSGFVALLQRYAAQTDLIVGVPFDLRADGTRATVGPLVNWVALRTRVAGSDTLDDLTARHAVTFDEARAHAALPIESVAGAASLPFNVAFDADLEPWRAGSWSARPLDAGLGAQELSLLVAHEGDQPACLVAFDAGLHEGAFVEQLARHYGCMLRGLLRGERVEAVELTTPEERSLLLETWARRPAGSPQGVTVHALFERQARLAPDRPALTCGAQTLSFRELNERANRLAHALLARGMRRGELVALQVEPSLESVVGLLGILKAGCAYLPLDVRAPERRVAFQLQDAACRLLLRTRQGADVGCETALMEDLAAPLVHDPVGVAEAGDLAYCIYTSGSTGTPKGVLVEHRHVVRLMLNDAPDFEFSERDVWTVFHNFNFDFSVFETFGALFHGGRVVIVPEETKHDPAGLRALLARERVTVLCQTPSAFYRLAEQPNDAQLALRYVIFGGEALDPARLRGFRASHPDVRLVNGYGITETTVFSTFQTLTDELLEQPAGIIGGPSGTTSCYVLDRWQRPVPMGVPGEIYIGGLGVARGYLNRPALTAERFVPNPFAEPGVSRLYRSGDLARWTSGGRLEFLGRLDDQVQIRGLRVELGEVESQLARLAGVRQAAVLVREDEHGEKYLAAYVVSTLADAREEIAARHRQELKAVLPAYMVPAAFVFVEALPLTPNGKLDKAALPAPDRQAQAAYVEPAGDVERRVASLWQELLGLPQSPGAHSDFFALGGHSLLAMRVVSALNAAFDVQVPIRALFENSTVRALAAYVEQRASASRAPLARVARGGPLALSFAQQRLWFIDRLEQASPQYNVPVALELVGELDVAALQRALDALVARHEVLRSTYRLEDGAGAQVIAPACGVPIGRLASCSPEALQAEAARPFDLGRDLMLRVQLARRSSDVHVLLFATHHIAADGWSTGILVREFAALYEAETRGESARLEPLPVQYADYAAWQRKEAAEPGFQARLAYWKAQLAELPVLHGLPTDRPRPARQQYAGANFVTRLTPLSLAALRGWAESQRATLFMALEAVFALLLARWSGADDVVVGSPVAGRVHKDVEGLIGCFVNTLVLRNRLQAEADGARLLSETRRLVLDAFSNQDVPFEMLVEVLQPERSLSHAPLHQLAFTLQNNEPVTLRLPGLTVRQAEGVGAVAKFDLNLAAGETPEGLVLTWNYAVSLFDPATIERLASSFTVLVDALVATPEQPCARLPVMTREERTALLASAAPARSFESPACLHEIFERRAQAAPEATALTVGGRSQTYGELDARANQVARRLLARGVGPDVLVGVCLERSCDLVVGILGVLKAGGAYVPLDPSYPLARLTWMLTDARLGVVLTERGSPLATCAADVVLVDDCQAESRAGLGRRAAPDDLAYVIYTSGSSGMPKGVMVEHRHVARLMQAAELHFTFGPQDVWTLFHSYAFDFSVWELWGALLYGGRLVIVALEEARAPERLYELLWRERVSVLNQTPSAFYGLADLAQGRAPLTALRYVIFGGEALSPSRLRAWCETYGDERPRLVNMYGITETTVHVTYRRLLVADCRSEASVIGRPLADLGVYVGRDGELVPTGVPGELYVAGGGVARGYLNRPELTAERFVRDPFAPRSDARLYRTGDLVRARADGELEYLGRIDDQVKIRGFRVELGEIDARLRDCAGVRDARVVALDGRLVAYVVPAPGAEPAELVATLKGLLRTQLPEHMLPAAWVTLAGLPLTANGKLDRRALPAPAWQAAAAHVPPRTEIERRLAEIWASLLKLEQVGVEDNFFAIGGDSILSIQAVARANQAGIAVSTRDLFEHQTIAALAVQAALAAERRLPQDEVTGAAELLPLQRQLLLEGDDEGRAHFNQALLLVTPQGFDGAFLRAVVAALLRRHDALRLRFVDGRARHEPYSDGLLEACALVEPATPDLSARCQHFQQSFDLAHGPLFRAVYFEPGRLFLVAHHAVVDAVSWRILLADLEQAHAQHRQGLPVTLGPKTSSFQQWSARLVAHAPSFLPERDYWLAQGATAPLPVDRQVPHAPQGSTRVRRVRLDVERTQALLQRCSGAYRTTINELLLAGVYLGLRSVTGHATLCVALEAHGREPLFDDLDTTQTVSWFTSVFPLALHSASDDVAEVVKAVKECHRAPLHKGLGYGLLRDVLRDEALRAQPAPPLVFNYLGQLDQSLNRQTAFQPAPEPTGATVDPRRPRPYRIGLNGGIAGGRLDLALDYSALEYDEATIAGWASAIEDGLGRVIAHCQSVTRGVFTPSDFPLARVTQAALDVWQRDYPELARLYPATAMQQGLHFHSTLERSAYVTQLSVVFEGELLADALRAAWELVTSRHDVLRTAFVGHDESLHQLVVERVELPWREEDWRALQPDEQRALFERLRADDKAAGFDFSRPPLQRLALVRLAADRWRLLWTHHHALLDGWCAPLVYREVLHAYHRLRRAERVELEAAPRYEDYVRWLAGRDQAAARAYWRGYLAEVEAPTPLSIDRLPGDGGRGPAERSRVLDAQTSARLEAFARSRQITLNTLVQVAWGYLLHRYSGERRVTFGAIASGRPAEVAGIERMVGLFINTLVVNLNFAPGAGVAELLAETQHAFLQALQYGYLPLTEIQKQSGVAPGVALFDSLLVFENYPVGDALAAEAESSASGLRLSGGASDEQTNYKLTLTVGLAGRLGLRCSYRAEEFAAATIERLLQHLEHALVGLTARQRVAEIDLLTPAERESYALGNRVEPSYPRDQRLEELFEAQAARTPHSVAVIFRERQLTYAELDAWANDVARELESRQIGTEDLVGVLADRSLEMVAGLLGILKAGAAYVPLDPSYPPARLRDMIEDSGARVVLTQPDLRHILDDCAPGAALVLAAQAPPPASGGARRERRASASGLAYVMYTSGSTGRPKGVMVEHRSIVRLVVGNHFVPLGPHTRILQASSCSFDVATFEIWGSLLNGGALVLYPERHIDLALLNRELARTGIDVLWLTSGVFEQWTQQLPEQGALRYVLAGGDVVNPRAVERVHRAWRDVHVVNGYGPTENATFTTCHLVPRDVDYARPVSLGRAINGTTLHVLDELHEPLPLGAIGELYVGGDGVARGYWRRPELDRERFVSVHGERLYKTGDLVRRSTDGTLDFVGRVDDQVKVRGFRIELGEIEARLAGLEQVKEAVVVALGVGAAKRLVAYVVPAQPCDDLAGTLKRSLAAELPEWMIPAAIVTLPALPLSPNGKVDRRALPAPDWQAPADAYVAPRTELEARLAAIWAKLLRLDRVGVDDNFFAIGGDSILSIQAVSRASQAGIALTTRQLFEHPTIAELAAQVRDAQHALAPQEAVTGGLTLLPIQREFLAGQELAPEHFNQSLLLQAPSELDAAALRAMVRALLERHDALRLRFDAQGAEHQPLGDALVDASALVEPLPADLSARCAHYQQSFDLARGPLFRAVLFEPGRLLLVAHHLVVDGVSWRIILADLELAYAQQRAGEALRLPPKTTSFQAWGEALARHAGSLQGERAYWLADAPAPALPVDRVAPCPTYASSRRERVRLDPRETSALLQDCHAAYRTTINELLLSGVYLGLRRFTGAPAQRLDLEGHGREPLFGHLDTTQTVGWFTVKFPLTLLSPADAPADVIKAVKEQYRAVPNGGIGYGLLRHVVGEAALAAVPAPEIVFNYLGQFDQSVGRESVFAAAPESMGAATSLARRRSHRLGISARVSGGALELALDYSADEYDESSMRRLAGLLVGGLRDVIGHCQTVGRGAATPSDFPLARVSQARLDAWQRAYPGLARLYPATGMQTGMYFHGLLERGAYVTQVFPVFAGELSTRHLRRAWQLVSQRHDVFRTAFVQDEGRLLQLVSREAPLPWAEHDWRGLPADAQSARFAETLAADKAAGFDLAQAPLQRVALFRLADTRWQMLWTHHHMLLDGWCAPLVYREVLRAYECLLAERALDLPAAPLYEDYARWLQARDEHAARAYFRAQLADVQAPTPLAIDKLAPGPRARFEEQTLELEAAATRRLEALARAHATTVNTVMQLAWALLLHRYSGENQVVFGAVVSGRPAEVAGIERMVGLFINTLPVKFVFTPGERTVDALRRLHGDFQSAQEHAYLPLAAIQEQSGVSRGRALFDSLLAFENYPLDVELARGAQGLANLRVESSAIDERTNYKLTLVVTLTERLKVRCGYQADVLAPDAVTRLLGHLDVVLTELATRERLDDVGLLTAAEHAALAGWNDTRVDLTLDASLHAGFVRQALARPEAVAVRDGEGALTYGELLRHAHALRGELLRLGVRREELIGVRLPKGRGQAVATLGILMAEAAYLPLETSWPDERCAAVRRQSSCRRVVGEEIDLRALPPSSGDLAELAAEVRGEGLSASLAYVIFTSGSTGTPKGVAIEHGAALNTLADVNRRHAVDERDRILAFSALSFDLSVYDLFGLFAVGGEVVFPEARRASDPRHWAELIERHGVTLWDSVPAAADLLAQHYEAAGRPCPAPLRSIWMSGDWIPPTLPARLWRVFPHASVHSMGGATEASIWSIHHPVTEDTSGSRSVPYGRPMANQSFHVLDRRLAAVPVGVVGELFIGGRGLARGYYADDARTAERFIEHADLGRRLYRTGDLGRYLPDGTIEFAGRIDHQVKIRGFRIELGEIEAVLARQAEVKEALVEVKGAGHDRYLAAYVVPAPGNEGRDEALVARLRAAVEAALPRYMSPAAYVLLARLPLTDNGKIDKQALPEPATRSRSEYVAPSGATEQALAEVWRELLGGRDVGVTENFFEAGGNSLLAMQLLYRVEERLGCRLELADVFSYQTIRLLGRFIEAVMLDEPPAGSDADEPTLEESQF